jgi:TolB-like protein
MTGEGLPTNDQIVAALEELLRWPAIARSPQVGALLRYVVEKTIDGDENSIKAYAIAVDVFGRPPTFDPQSDPIVRVQARRLRTLLEQYYEQVAPAAPVQIRLPLGRYVPEFIQRAERAIGAVPVAAAPVGKSFPPPDSEVSTPPEGVRWLAIAALVVVISVALAVIAVRLLPASTPATAHGVPVMPAVAVGGFDNLTGNPQLDTVTDALAGDIATRLGRFEALRVVGNDPAALWLRGSVQETAGQLSVRAILSQGEAGGVVWSANIVPSAPADAAPLDEAMDALTVRIASPGGPLHAPGLAWLATQSPSLVTKPSLYLCQLRYMAWRANRRVELAAEGIDCLARLLIDDPDNGVARAMDAGLRSWRSQVMTMPSGGATDLLGKDLAEAGRAVALDPKSSFVYEQQGLVLSRAGSFDASFGAFEKALELNPDNMDARAAYGLVLWLDGQWTRGSDLVEEALAKVAVPPAWYYEARAFNAMREGRYFDAIDAAQAMVAGDDEFGPLIALAAAPLIGRADLVDRYRPMVIGNPRFQATGILPRIEWLLGQPVLTERLRTGLTLAGVPPSALNAPFRPDGTPRI